MNLNRIFKSTSVLGGVVVGVNDDRVKQGSWVEKSLFGELCLICDWSDRWHLKEEAFLRDWLFDLTLWVEFIRVILYVYKLCLGWLIRIIWRLSGGQFIRDNTKILVPFRNLHFLPWVVWWSLYVRKFKLKLKRSPGRK